MEQSMRTETKAPAHLSFSFAKTPPFTWKVFVHTHPKDMQTSPRAHMGTDPDTLQWELSASCKGQGNHRISVPGQGPAVPEWPHSGPGQPPAPCSSHWAPSAAHLGGKEQQWGTSSRMWQNSNATESKFPWQTFSTKEREECQTLPWMEQGYWGRLRQSLEQKHLLWGLVHSPLYCYYPARGLFSMRTKYSIRKGWLEHTTKTHLYKCNWWDLQLLCKTWKQFPQHWTAGSISCSTLKDVTQLHLRSFLSSSRRVWHSWVSFTSLSWLWASRFSTSKYCCSAK